MSEKDELPAECEGCWIQVKRKRHPFIYVDTCNACFRKTSDPVYDDKYKKER